MLYADDAVLLCSDKTGKGLKHKSETELKKIENWVAQLVNLKLTMIKPIISFF